ncbi:MAG: UDP-2,4-diacetamido-2,4,6-trideoxy-beta-L-altropyranose hydrolase [Lachnospiraceae bacterium]|nr:UDP-2,4-diacetamido-2,4,6-trideoxy-beta-L-altropyranose hydrolase [Lachnospiraceae bacterium]
MIWIRADANKEIGSGHMMRCLSVAAALEKCGEQVLFVVADEEATQLLAQREQVYHVLHSDYRDMESELSGLEELVLQEKPDMILVDSYFATNRYLEQLSACTKTAYMDDLFRVPYPVDVVINYNIYGDLLPYQEQAHSRNQAFLLGCAYVPLREEFQNIDSRKETEQVPHQVREQVQNVLITTGGGDKYNLAGQVLGAVLAEEKTKALQYYVVSGAFNSHLPELKRLEAEHENVHIHTNVTKMSELMQSCDVAISAAGSTMYELCAVGVPTLCFSFVDNQEKMVQTFVDKGMVHFGGDYLKDGEEMVTELVKKLCELVCSKELRQCYSGKARLLVDGKGAERIADSLSSLMKDN